MRGDFQRKIAASDTKHATTQRSEPRFSEEKQKSREYPREASDSIKSRTCVTPVGGRPCRGDIISQRKNAHTGAFLLRQLTAAARGFCNHAAAGVCTACGTTKIIGHPKGDRLFL